MADLIETVGARLVILGQREYQAAMSEARTSMEALSASAKTVAVSSDAMRSATITNQAAQKELAAVMRTARTAQSDYNAALRAAAAAEAEATAAGEVYTAEKRAEAAAATAAAAAIRDAALVQVAASEEAAVAATVAASEVEAAEARKVAAAGASSKALKTAATAMALVAGVVAFASVKMAADFQQSTERLVTSAGESQANLELVRRGILNLAGEVGYSAEALSAAMYKIESGGQHGAAGLDVLKAAAQGAKTENADLAVVSDALTSAMTDYHLPASEAANVTSKLVAATSQGKMTFEELAGSMSAVLPIASGNHVALNDILGDLASMTVHGMSAQQATQNLSDVIRHMAGPTVVQSKELATLGINAQQLRDDLGSKGLSGTLLEITSVIEDRMGPGASKVIVDLQTALKGLPPTVQDLGRKVLDGSISMKDFTVQAKKLDPIAYSQAKAFATMAGTFYQIGTQQQTGQQAMQSYTDALRRATGDATGLNVALMLTGENTGITTNAIGVISRATADASNNVLGWEEIQGTLNVKLSQAKDGLGSLAISIGTYLLPPLTVLVGWIAVATTWLSQHQAVALTLAGVIGGALVLALILATAAVYNFAVGILFVEGVLSPVVLVIGLVVLAVAALAVAAYLIITNWSTISAFFVGLWSNVKAVFAATWAWIVASTQTAASAVLAFFRPAVEGIVAAWNWMRDIAVAVWNWVLNIVRIAVTAIIGFFQPLVDAIRSRWGEIQAVTTFVWNVIVGFFQVTWTIISTVFRVGVNIISTILSVAWQMIVGVLEPVWTGIRLFFGIVWAAIVGVFNVAVALIKGVLDLAWVVIRTAVQVAWDIIVAIFRIAWDAILAIFKLARDIIIGVINVFLDIVTGNWSRAWNDIRATVLAVMTDIWVGTKAIATDIWQGLVAIFTSLWQGVKDVMTNLWNDLKGVFVAGANGVIDVVNGFLSIVNKVAGAIGFSINLRIDHVPALAEGGVIPVRFMAEGGALGALFSEVGSGFVTNGPRAIVGEGNPNHPEYVIPTDPAHRGRALGLFSSLARSLGLASGGQIPAGAPGYADGGILGDIWGGITSVAGSVARGFDAAVDWVGNVAAQGLKAVIGGVWPALPVPGNSFAGFVPAELNDWRQKAMDFLDGKYQAQQAAAAAAGGLSGPGGAPTVGGNLLAWIQAAEALTGVGPSWTPGLSTLIMRESGGNPRAINLTDSNARAGHPSQGLMQTIPSTFAAYHQPGTSNSITDPVANIAAGINYIKARYGSISNVQQANPNKAPRGYSGGGVLDFISARAAGGPVMAGTPYLVGERGPELFVPARSGGIVPAADTAKLRGGGDTAGSLSLGTTITVEAGAIVIHQAADPQACYEATKRGLADAVARR